MKRLIRLVAKMYPGPWRDRYGDEFEALLDEVGVNWRVALNVLTGAVVMQVQRWQKTLAGLPIVSVAVFAVSRWVEQRPYITPGTHQVYRMDSTAGAISEFLVLPILVLAGVMTLARVPRAGRAFAIIGGSYLAAVALVSLLTPRTIVNVGDSYCWDLWCVGVQHVNATPQGENILYTADVSLFADSTEEQILRADPSGKQFFYVMDDRGRRFPIVKSGIDGDLTVKPGESLKSALTFVVPASARTLYLTGDAGAPAWVRLYFGSDLNPFHRRTLLRVV